MASSTACGWINPFLSIAFWAVTSLPSSKPSPGNFTRKCIASIVVWCSAHIMELRAPASTMHSTPIGQNFGTRKNRKKMVSSSHECDFWKIYGLDVCCCLRISPKKKLWNDQPLPFFGAQRHSCVHTQHRGLEEGKSRGNCSSSQPIYGNTYTDTVYIIYIYRYTRYILLYIIIYIYMSYV